HHRIDVGAGDHLLPGGERPRDVELLGRRRGRFGPAVAHGDDLDVRQGTQAGGVPEAGGGARRRQRARGRGGGTGGAPGGRRAPRRGAPAAPAHRPATSTGLVETFSLSTLSNTTRYTWPSGASGPSVSRRWTLPWLFSGPPCAYSTKSQSSMAALTPSGGGS